MAVRRQLRHVPRILEKWAGISVSSAKNVFAPFRTLDVFLGSQQVTMYKKGIASQMPLRRQFP